MVLLYGLVTIINFLFYLSINWYIKRKANNKERIKNANDRQLWIWRNTFCSLVHAVIAGIWSIACFIEEPELLTDPSKIFSMDACFFSRILLPSSTGYFIYDFADIFINDGFRQWEVLSHHVAISVTLFMTYLQYIFGYSVCSLIIELNSINLHTRRLLRMLNIQLPLVTKINKYITAFTTIIFRGGFSLILLFAYLGDRDMNLITTILGGLAIIIMLGTNIGISYRIYLTDFSGKSSTNKSADEDKLVT